MKKIRLTKRTWIIIGSSVLGAIIVTCVLIWAFRSEESGVGSGEVKQYIGNSVEECSRILFLCSPGWEIFHDGKGCGCKLINEDLKESFCTSASRNVTSCNKNNNPVCGWFDPSKIQCIKYPCANNYGNSCEACKDENIIYWTEGSCPE